jgi:hypothetical protein
MRPPLVRPAAKPVRNQQCGTTWIHIAQTFAICCLHLFTIYLL